MIWLTAALSVADSVRVAAVPLVISTLAVSVREYVALPSPVKVNLLATMSSVPPLLR